MAGGGGSIDNAKGGSGGAGGGEDARRVGEIERLFAEFAPKFPKAPQMNAEQLSKEMKASNAKKKKLVVVDVRTKDEQDVSMIKTALRKEEFEARKAEFKDHKVVAYCTIGYRSGQYVEKLCGESFDAYNLKGSILSWTHAGGELVSGTSGGGGGGGGGASTTKRVHTFGKDWDLASTDCEGVFFAKPAVTVVKNYIGGLIPDALKPWKWGGGK